MPILIWILRLATLAAVSYTAYAGKESIEAIFGIGVPVGTTRAINARRFITVAGIILGLYIWKKK